MIEILQLLLQSEKMKWEIHRGMAKHGSEGLVASTEVEEGEWFRVAGLIMANLIRIPMSFNDIGGSNSLLPKREDAGVVVQRCHEAAVAPPVSGGSAGEGASNGGKQGLGD